MIFPKIKPADTAVIASSENTYHIDWEISKRVKTPMIINIIISTNKMIFFIRWPLNCQKSIDFILDD